MATAAEPTPRQRVEAECARRGKRAVVEGCVRLLGGDTSDISLLVSMGGLGVRKFLDGRDHSDEYWFRVWAARGLLWAWDDLATAAVKEALHDEAWRVREMCAKVVARHLVDDALDTVLTLRDDPVSRVRAAANRAVDRLTQSGA